MKKIITLLLLAVCAVFALTACSSGQNNSTAANNGATVSDNTGLSSNGTSTANSPSDNSTENSAESSLTTSSSETSLSGDASDNSDTSTNESSSSAAPEQSKPQENADGKVLVAYFSCTGTTEGIANKIALELGTDTYKIEAAQPYTDDDLNYNNSSSRSTKEQNDPNCRPEISGSIANMSDYDTVYIGYPIWWGQAPKIIYTFVESYDFSGKTIVPFCTSASSGVGSSATNLHGSASSANWLDGTRLTSSTDISNWINELGI